jgi:tetratricopeptide (TPR) repeat protein
MTPAEATAQFNAGQQYLKDYNKAAGTGAPGMDKMAAPTDGMGPSTTQPTGVGSHVPKPVMTDHSPAAMPTPTATPQAPAAPLTPMVTEPLQHDADEQPYIVTSLATGIRAKGLADLMKSAENQMRDGHFNAALDSYDSAEQVAPNNPFIAMGRGFAEMGASYYGKAELDLRRAIAAEPALLAGRYDIKGFLGEDRLKFVVNDLTDIYQSEKDSVRPAVLLGFISHNEGDDTAAAKYLNAADQRAGGRDPIITVMREDWGFVTPK